MDKPSSNFETFDSARIIPNKAEQKNIPDSKPPQSYSQIVLGYDYSTTDRKQTDDLRIEGCEMTTSFGVQSKAGSKPGSMEHSVMCAFDMGNTDHAKFIECMNRLHFGCSHVLFTQKGAVKMYNFKVEDAEGTGLKNPVYRPRDEVTGEPIEGRKPSMFFKLFCRGKPPLGEQTLFTGPDGKVIPWTFLQNVEMKFIPLIHVKRIYIGSKASIQMEIVSAIVTSIHARNTTTQQTATLQRLQHERAGLADTVAAQLAKLSADRQDQLLSPPCTTESEPGQPTFAGISSNQPTMTSLQQDKVPSLADFTSNAPLRLPTVTYS